jgi:hypothetical protein
MAMDQLKVIARKKSFHLLKTIVLCRCFKVWRISALLQQNRSLWEQACKKNLFNAIKIEKWNLK